MTDMENYAFWCWLAVPRTNEHWQAMDLPGTLPLNRKAGIISEWAREAILRGDDPAANEANMVGFEMELRWLRRVFEQGFDTWRRN